MSKEVKKRPKLDLQASPYTSFHEPMSFFGHQDTVESCCLRARRASEHRSQQKQSAKQNLKLCLILNMLKFSIWPCVHNDVNDQALCTLALHSVQKKPPNQTLKSM